MAALGTYPFLWCLIAEVKGRGVPIYSNIGISNESSVFPTVNFTASAKSKGGEMYWGKNNYEVKKVFFIRIILPFYFPTFLLGLHNLLWAFTSDRFIYKYVLIIISISGNPAYQFSSLCGKEIIWELDIWGNTPLKNSKFSYFMFCGQFIWYNTTHFLL